MITEQTIEALVQHTMSARTDGSTRMDVTVGEAFGIGPGDGLCIVCLDKGPEPLAHKETCPYRKRDA